MSISLASTSTAVARGGGGGGCSLLYVVSKVFRVLFAFFPAVCVLFAPTKKRSADVSERKQKSTSICIWVFIRRPPKKKKNPCPPSYVRTIPPATLNLSHLPNREDQKKARVIQSVIQHYLGARSSTVLRKKKANIAAQLLILSPASCIFAPPTGTGK